MFQELTEQEIMWLVELNVAINSVEIEPDEGWKTEE